MGLLAARRPALQPNAGRHRRCWLRLAARQSVPRLPARRGLPVDTARPALHAAWLAAVRPGIRLVEAAAGFSILLFPTSPEHQPPCTPAAPHRHTPKGGKGTLYYQPPSDRMPASAASCSATAFRFPVTRLCADRVTM
eukprot:scaffold7630_cov122-Isochrysis_galbana.AAC.7